ncbi:POL [Symbiodinium sp. CCMP2592]|nr:POL [Symbiodinium sp. CCMP2592]
MGARKCSRHAYPRSTRMGAKRCSRHAYPQPEWGPGGRGAAAKRCSRHAYPQPEWGPGGRGAAAERCSRQAYPQPEWGPGGRGAAAKRCSRHAYPQPEWGRRGAAATLILNQNGGQGEEAQRRGAAATLILTQNGGQGDEAQPRRGAAATLILNQNGGQGEEAQPRRGAAATLILNQNGGQGEEAQPRRGAAATLILHQNGGEEVQPPRRGVELELKKTEARASPGVEAQAEEDRGKDEVRILNPKRDGDGDEDPSGIGSRPCIFSQDGRGGPAQSSRKSCALCSLENLQLALDSRIAKGNLVRQLKQWRRNGSPTYEAAFGMGSLCVLSTSEQYGLRAKAGQPPKFKPSWSWLHKKSPRLKHFLLGRPILRANPSMSSSSRQYVKAASSPRSGIGSWRLLSAYVGCRKAAQRIAAATKKDARGSFWQGKKAMLRVYRRRWWLARRRLKRRYSALMVRTEKPFLSYKAAKWAIEENILQAGFRVQISRQNHPQWKFLTETGSLLFFQSLNESLGLAQKQLATATCSVNNALGRQACDITLQGAQDLLKARGYEHDWCTFLRQGGRILSPLVVDCALEKSGFKLQHCQNLEVWPAGAQSILQIRGDRNSCHERWVALISCHSRIYLLDCFQDEPEPTVNCQLGVQPCDTYAVIRL